jgi:hypothetical protein
MSEEKSGGPFYAKILKRLNPALRWLLRSPLHGLLSGQLCLVRYEGRRSGRQIEIPVGYQDVGDAIVVMISHAPSRLWWRNFLEPRPATLTIRGRARALEGVWLEPGSEAFRERAEQTFRRSRLTARIFGVTLDPERGLSDEQLHELAEFRGAVCFTPR